MEKKFVTVVAFIGQDRFNLTLTRNEFKRGQRRFDRDVRIVRRQDIQEKKAISINNGKCYCWG